MSRPGLQGRDKNIAAAMVDPNVVLELKDKIGRDKLKGDILTLTGDRGGEGRLFRAYGRIRR